MYILPPSNPVTGRPLRSVLREKMIIILEYITFVSIYCQGYFGVHSHLFYMFDLINFKHIKNQEERYCLNSFLFPTCNINNNCISVAFLFLSLLKQVFLFFMRFYCKIIMIILSLLPEKVETLCRRKSLVLPTILDSAS